MDKFIYWLVSVACIGAAGVICWHMITHGTGWFIPSLGYMMAFCILCAIHSHVQLKKPDQNNTEEQNG